MVKEYFSVPEAEDLWSSLYRVKDSGNKSGPTASFPEEAVRGSFRKLPPGHLAIHPDAPRLIEEQMLDLRSSQD